MYTDCENVYVDSISSQFPLLELFLWLKASSNIDGRDFIILYFTCSMYTSREDRPLYADFKMLVGVCLNWLQKQYL